MNPDLSIVIPAYNEADRIVVTLQRTAAYLAMQPAAVEVLVVSDGSTDATTDVVSRMPTADNVRMQALHYAPNRGKGYAVRYGMLRASGRIIMFMDADYAVPIESIQPGLALLEGGADIAMASRALAQSVVDQHQNLPRELSARAYNLVQRLYLGLVFQDTQCGFKLFRRMAAHDLFARQRLNSVIFDAEILWLAQRHGYRIAEFPVCWRHVDNSRIQYDSIKKLLFVWQELFRIRRLHRR